MWIQYIVSTLKNAKAELEAYIISGINAHQKLDRAALKMIERESPEIEPLTANRFSQDSHFILLHSFVVKRLDWF